VRANHPFCLHPHPQTPNSILFHGVDRIISPYTLSRGNFLRSVAARFWALLYPISCLRVSNTLHLSVCSCTTVHQTCHSNWSKRYTCATSIPVRRFATGTISHKLWAVRRYPAWKSKRFFDSVSLPNCQSQSTLFRLVKRLAFGLHSHSYTTPSLAWYRRALGSRLDLHLPHVSRVSACSQHTLSPCLSTPTHPTHKHSQQHIPQYHDVFPQHILLRNHEANDHPIPRRRGNHHHSDSIQRPRSRRPRRARNRSSHHGPDQVLRALGTQDSNAHADWHRDGHRPAHGRHCAAVVQRPPRRRDGVVGADVSCDSDCCGE
jgi:hypothetical protein